MMARGEPIVFALPGFPGKSPNLYKVLGHVPDKAEWVALGFLQSLCERIRAEYAPGARVVICSDGRVFSDLVGMSDSDITRYQAGLAGMLQELDAGWLSLFNMEHAFGPTGDFDALRSKLMEQYAEPLETFKAGVRKGGEAASLYRGIARVLLEDMLGPDNRESLATCRKLCRERAYGVIQRSKAWGRLVAERFPDVLRLSIHPQPCGSGKIGIHFLDTANNWLTPWHGVAVESEGRFVLMRRREAEQMGARLVMSEGRPSHFAASGPVPSSQPLPSGSRHVRPPARS
jgi:pyoverdine/dityrosine biosynthesis protein Dit1